MYGVPLQFIADPAYMAGIFNVGVHDVDCSVQTAVLKAAVAYLLECDHTSRERMAGVVPLLLNVITFFEFYRLSRLL